MYAGNSLSPMVLEDPHKQRTWLITGCSSGLGKDLVLAALQTGDRVIATARRLEDLDYVQNEKGAFAVQLDVCNPEDVLRAKIGKIVTQFGSIDVLVNNAGFVAAGVWEELNEHVTRRQFDTNFFGTMNLTRIVLSHMRPRRSGTIFFMSSIAAWHGVAGSGPYASSKSALEGAAECLAGEVNPLGIRVHLLVLGRFRTNILSTTNKKTSLDAVDGIEDYATVKKNLETAHLASNGRQPGDPKRAMASIVDLVKLENLTKAQLRKVPLCIPFGAEATDVMRAKCESTLSSLRDWVQFAAAMDFAEETTVPSFL